MGAVGLAPEAADVAKLVNLNSQHFVEFGSDKETRMNRRNHLKKGGLGELLDADDGHERSPALQTNPKSSGPLTFRTLGELMSLISDGTRRRYIRPASTSF